MSDYSMEYKNITVPADVYYEMRDRLAELERIRKKANVKVYEDKFVHCPRCDAGLGYKWDRYPTGLNNLLELYSFCPFCGQAIKFDWSNGETHDGKI